MDINFENEKTFSWSQNKIYDFYIPRLNCIIEAHGSQHYRKSKFNRSLEDERKNDNLKEQLAKYNGINNYIVIDCRKSELEWIKNSVLNSELDGLFDLSAIDWLKCEKHSSGTKVKEICDLWDIHKTKDSLFSTSNLAQITKMDKSTIIKYLKKGNILKWCNYDVNQEKKLPTKMAMIKNRKRVEIFDKNNISLGVFNSAKELSEISINEFGVKLSAGHISNVARKVRTHHRGYIFEYV